MKKIIYALFLISFTTACSPIFYPGLPPTNRPTTGPTGGNHVQSYTGDLTPMRDNMTGLYGYVNSYKRWVIKPQFNSANYFYNGLARVEKGRYYGAINTSGKWIVKPAFDAIHNCEAAIRSIVNGRSVGEELWAAKDPARGLYGYLNHFGEWHIKPQFESISNFDHRGLAIVKVPYRGWGAINRSGKWIVKPGFAYEHDVRSALARLM